jgi:hypothetical protein
LRCFAVSAAQHDGIIRAGWHQICYRIQTALATLGAPIFARRSARSIFFARLSIRGSSIRL